MHTCWLSARSRESSSLPSFRHPSRSGFVPALGLPHQASSTRRTQVSVLRQTSQQHRPWDHSYHRRPSLLNPKGFPLEDVKRVDGCERPFCGFALPASLQGWCPLRENTMYAAGGRVRAENKLAEEEMWPGYKFSSLIGSLQSVFCNWARRLNNLGNKPGRRYVALISGW
jgi:hypothetical protein